MTPVEFQILDFMQVFGGRTYEVVLSKTFFSSKNTAQKSVFRLVAKNVLKREKTGLLAPKSSLVFGADVFESATQRWGERAKHNPVAISSVKHFIYEQIAYYWLSTIGEGKRASVKNDSSIYYHTPDLIFLDINGATTFFEIELTIKSQNRYKEIIGKLVKLNELDAVVYILANENEVVKLAKIMPSYSKLYFITLDEMIRNIQMSSQIGAKAQKEILNLNKEAQGGLFIS